MSIYVSIPCLGFDSELERTIDTAIGEAQNGDDVVVAVACIGDFDFYKNIKESYSHIENIKIKYYEYKNNIGIGKARILAASEYNNEEYFLQVDSHTNFYRFWDVYLKNRHYDFKTKFKKEKFIFTGYPAQYFYKEKTNVLSYIDRNTKIEVNNYLGFNKWVPTESLLSWTYDKIENIDKNLESILEENHNFLPAPKVCGSFIFGDSNFAKNMCIDENIFWGEEIYQSIELIDNGFTLVYPGEYSPIAHLYNYVKDKDQYGYREEFFDFINKNNIYTENEIVGYITEYHNSWIKNPNNKNKIQRFEQYNGISFLNNKDLINIYPKEYIN